MKHCLNYCNSHPLIVPVLGATFGVAVAILIIAVSL